MTITKTIEAARKHGIGSAYARVLSGAIRAANSERAVKAYRAAIAEDGAEALFLDLNTSCPVAA